MSWQTNNYGGGMNQQGRMAYAPVSTDISTKSALIAKVYGLMGLSMLASLPGIAVGWNNIELFAGWNWWLFLIGWWGVIAGAYALARTPGINVLMLLVAGFATGFMISVELAFYAATQGVGILYQAFLMAAGVFGGLSAYAVISKRNFNFLYGFISAGMVAIGVLWLVIIVSPLLGFAVPSFAFLIWCWLGLMIMCAYLLFQTSRLIRDGIEEDAVFFALSLYMTFVNIFLFILRILGSSRD